MKYSEKLKDPRWQRKRLEVMQRDDFTCLVCGDKSTTLNVHHKQYSGNPWDAALDQLETLCEVCHEKRSELNKFFLSIPSKLAIPLMVHYETMSKSEEVIEFLFDSMEIDHIVLRHLTGLSGNSLYFFPHVKTIAAGIAGTGADLAEVFIDAKVGIKNGGDAIHILMDRLEKTLNELNQEIEDAVRGSR